MKMILTTSSLEVEEWVGDWMIQGLDNYRVGE